MAGHVVLKKEIFQGIFGGLGMILVVVAIGSVIASSLPEHELDAPHAEGAHAEEGAAPEATGEAPKADAPAAEPAADDAAPTPAVEPAADETP